MPGFFGGVGGGGGVVGISPPFPPDPPGPPVSAALIVDDPSSMLSASQETKAQEKATIATAKSIFFILFRIKVLEIALPFEKFEGFRQACCLDVRPVLGSTARPSEEKNHTSRITSASENHAVLKSVLYICSRCIKIRQLISEGKVTAGFPRHC